MSADDPSAGSVSSSLFGWSDVGLGSRHAKQLGLNDQVRGLSELVLSDNFVLLKPTVMDDPIANKVLALRVHAEVRRAAAERASRGFDCDAVRPRPQLEDAVAHGRIGKAGYRIAAAACRVRRHRRSAANGNT